MGGRGKMNGQENNKFLGEEKISKLLLKFSIPCILSLLISSLYNIVDQIFIGNSKLGYLGNAATGVVYPITIIRSLRLLLHGVLVMARRPFYRYAKDVKILKILIEQLVIVY